MIEMPPERIASALGGTVAVAGPGAGSRPERAEIDSRECGPGDLFFGLSGAKMDGGRFAAQAVERGAWGVVVRPPRARELAGTETVFVCGSARFAAFAEALLLDCGVQPGAIRVERFGPSG